MTIPARGLFVAPCSREAALFAVKSWHYSRRLPAGRCQFWGVWFDGAFIGVVIVSRGSCQHIGTALNRRQDQAAEVTRIAMRPDHVPPVSQVLAVVVRLVKKTSPGLEALVSYADQRQHHHGGVYQGAGWIYVGQTHREATLLLHGREVHARTVSSKYDTRDLTWLRAHVDPNAARIDCPPKHKYVLPLTPTMRERLVLLAKPYPKSSREQSAESGTPQHRPAPSPGGSLRRGRIDPTCSLHLQEAAHA